MGLPGTRGRWGWFFDLVSETNGLTEPLGLGEAFADTDASEADGTAEQARTPRWMNEAKRARAAKLGGDHARNEMEGATYGDPNRVFDDADIMAMFDDRARVDPPARDPGFYMIGVDPGDPQPGSYYGLVGMYFHTRVDNGVRRVVDSVIVKAVDNFSTRRAIEACSVILYHVREARKIWPDVTIAIAIESINNQVAYDMITMFRRPDLADDLRDVHLLWENWTKNAIEQLGRPGPGIYPTPLHIDDSMTLFTQFMQNRRLFFDTQMIMPHFDKEVAPAAKRDRHSIQMRELFNQISNYRREVPKGIVNAKRAVYTGKTSDGEKDDMVAAIRTGFMGVIAILAATDRGSRRGAAAYDQVAMTEHLAGRMFGKGMPAEPIRTPPQIYDEGRATSGGFVEFNPF